MDSIRQHKRARTTLVEFHLFPKLSKELRFKIFDYFENQGRLLFVQRVATEAQREDHTAGWKIFTPMPAILHINQEFPVHALRIYQLLFPPEMMNNLYINRRSDLAYLLTPPYTSIVDISSMWHSAGEMQLACKYLCRYGRLASLAIDLHHTRYLEALKETAEAWVDILDDLKSLRALKFIHAGDGLLSERSDIFMTALESKPLPAGFHNLLQQQHSRMRQIDKRDQREEWKEWAEWEEGEEEEEGEDGYDYLPRPPLTEITLAKWLNKGLLPGLGEGLEEEEVYISLGRSLESEMD
jgi:hypothetical protein